MLKFNVKIEKDDVTIIEIVDRVLNTEEEMLAFLPDLLNLFSNGVGDNIVPYALQGLSLAMMMNEERNNPKDS